MNDVEVKPEEIKDYGVVGAHEVNVIWNGWSFTTIYGKHVGGWFIALPDWNVCVVSSDPSDFYYNRHKLSDAFNDIDKGEVVAKAIKEHWERLNNGES